jgi:hypothetical protein
MKRAMFKIKILIINFIISAFIVPSSFAAWPGDCNLTLWYKTNVRSNNGGNLYTSVSVNDSTGAITSYGLSNFDSGVEVADYTFATFYYNGSAWVSNSQRGYTLPTSTALAGIASLSPIESNNATIATFVS